MSKKENVENRLKQLKEEGNPLAGYIEALMTNMTPTVKEKLLADLSHHFNFLDMFKENMKNPEFAKEVVSRRERNG
tara:strand:+ start:7613 stop:7840 length:228 start_codon:yes stop_codon:yes gene_type:complete